MGTNVVKEKFLSTKDKAGNILPILGRTRENPGWRERFYQEHRGKGACIIFEGLTTVSSLYASVLNPTVRVTNESLQVKKLEGEKKRVETEYNSTNSRIQVTISTKLQT